MREIRPEPLTQEAFAPFGAVLARPREGRAYFEAALGNLRPGAWPSLSIAVRRDVAALPFTATEMERHEFSSQTFVPMEAGRWIVAVAPHAAAGGPDPAGLRVFVAEPDQGVTYGADVWHHPLTILDRPATFAIWMWRDSTQGDEEFATLAEPVRFAAP